MIGPTGNNSLAARILRIKRVWPLQHCVTVVKEAIWGRLDRGREDNKDSDDDKDGKEDSEEDDDKDKEEDCEGDEDKDSEEGEMAGQPSKVANFARHMRFPGRCTAAGACRCMSEHWRPTSGGRSSTCRGCCLRQRSSWSGWQQRARPEARQLQKHWWPVWKKLNIHVPGKLCQWSIRS